jgi:hypothetical protein
MMLTEALAARIRETNFLYSRMLGTESMAEPGKAIKISPKPKIRYRRELTGFLAGCGDYPAGFFGFYRPGGAGGARRRAVRCG